MLPPSAPNTCSYRRQHDDTRYLCAVVPAASDPFSVSGDLHGLMGGAPPEIRPLGDTEAWHRKLCVSPSGVLYEDAYLQVNPQSLLHLQCSRPAEGL